MDVVSTTGVAVVTSDLLALGSARAISVGAILTGVETALRAIVGLAIPEA